MSENSDNFMLGDIQISPQHNTMSRGEFVCRVQPKVMALLCYLHKHHDRVVANDELLEQVWEGRVVTHNSIQKSINALRAAFAEFDPNTEYVVYFSKRGYQLVTSNSNEQDKPRFSHKLWSRPFVLSGLVVLTIALVYLTYFMLAALFKVEPAVPPLYTKQFSQVKPYVSNTGRERIIEPYTNSERVAFVRDEPDIKGGMHSRLLMRGASGLEWQMSVARGQFIDLAWSASGRNLVAVDAHAATGEAQNTDDAHYYTFHIFTVDFKGEKLIEKNLLSHWVGKVSSVSWWDEGTLEFVAAQGTQTELESYRYNIAAQNLVELESQPGRGQLLATQLLNKISAELRRLDTGMQIRFFNPQQKLIGQSVFLSQIISMSWMADGSALLILSDEGQLSLLYTDGSLQQLNYAPKVNGRISRARSTDDGKSLVLTVESTSAESLATAQQPLPLNLPLNSAANTNIAGEESAMSFLAKAGGFIYTASTNK